MKQGSSEQIHDNKQHLLDEDMKVRKRLSVHHESKNSIDTLLGCI